MNLVVTQSSPVLVAQSEPTPAGNLPLTSTDRSRLGLPVTSLHVFDRPIHEPAETIRRALSHALVHYYPIAGRIAGSGRDVHLACTGDGVPFVAATASCTLQDVRFLHAPLVAPLDGLAVRYGGRGAGRAPERPPLLMMQVTEFACGGYVVAVTWNHAVADAFGVAQFLRAVGELADAGRRSSIPQLLRALGGPPSLAGLKPVAFAYTDVTIPWSFIDRVKAELRPCSTFDAVAAAVWQCRTRAIIDADPGSAAPLVFTANVRRHLGARDGYYGNCIASQVVAATSAAVANGGAAELAKLIRDAKERIPDALRNREPALGEELAGALRGYGALFVSSWGGIGLGDVDFGGGTPARVMANLELTVAPLCVPCLPGSRKDGHGVNVIAYCVTEEHVDGFHAALARLD